MYGNYNIWYVWNKFAKSKYVKYCWFFFLFQFGFYKTFKEICTGGWKLAVFLTHSLIHKMLCEFEEQSTCLISTLFVIILEHQGR